MTDLTNSYDRRTAEQWFRRRGLPAVVRGRPVALLVRIVPGLAFVAAFQLMTIVLDAVAGTDAEFDRRSENVLFEITYSVLLILLFVVPAVAAWLAACWVRHRLVDGRGQLRALAGLAAFIIGLPVIEVSTGHASYVVALLVDAALPLVFFGLAYVGLGSIAGWATRAALRQARLVAGLTGRALPLLLLFTAFGFFTAELWQLAASASRAQMWAVVGLFAIVTVLFLITMLSDELHRLADSAATPADSSNLEGTPFAPLAERGGLTASRVPLGRLERTNMVFVLVLTQALQAAAFAAVTFVFFVVFGEVAVSDSLIRSWTNQAPKPGEVFGISVPVPNELIHVSMFIAAVSALYFAASTVTDASYRKSFFEPVTEHLTVSLSARDAYLAELSAGQA